MKPAVTLIIEGPDGAGKTTLVERLRKVFAPSSKIAFTHHGAYLGETEIMPHYLKPLLGAHRAKVAGQTLTTILDRSWLAEPIYADAMRDGKSRISAQQYQVLEQLLLDVGGVVILCLPALATCHRAWAGRREREYLDARHKLEQVWVGYHDAFHTWAARGLTVLMYDYESDSELEDLLPILQQLTGVSTC